MGFDPKTQWTLLQRATKRMTRTQESRIEYLTILTAETIGRLDFMIAEAEGPVAEVNKTTSIEIADDLRAAQEALFRVVKANRRLVDAYYAEIVNAVALRRSSTVVPEMPGVPSPEVEDGDALIAETLHPGLLRMRTGIYTPDGNRAGIYGRL